MTAASAVLVAPLGAWAKLPPSPGLQVVWVRQSGGEPAGCEAARAACAERIRGEAGRRGAASGHWPEVVGTEATPPAAGSGARGEPGLDVRGRLLPPSLN